MTHVEGPPHKEGFLYIIQEGNNKYFKVGVTNSEESIKKRLSNLQCGNWRELTVAANLSKISDMNCAEKMAHEKLDPYHKNAGGGTEWFGAEFDVIKKAVDETAKADPKC